MSKKQVISCRSRDEMKKTADCLVRQGLMVKTVERVTPFHPEGLCITEYKVIIQDEQENGKWEDSHGFLNRIFRRITWRSDLHKTSALSESSVL